MDHFLKKYIHQEKSSLKVLGLLKNETPISPSPQASQFSSNEGVLINYCNDNYLGLSENRELIHKLETLNPLLASSGISTRFNFLIDEVHLKLEDKISNFLNTEASMLYSSISDAYITLFETLCQNQDVLFYDSYSHPLLKENLRLSGSGLYSYQHNDMKDLESQLKRSKYARFKFIITEGVFLLSGQRAPLNSICELAEKYEAFVIVDDTNGIGVTGPSGRGSTEYFKTTKNVDLILSSLGHLYNGFSLSFISGKKEIITWLKQTSKAYLFSSSPSPYVSTLFSTIFDYLETDHSALDLLTSLAHYFTEQLLQKNIKPFSNSNSIFSFKIKNATEVAKIVKELYKDKIYTLGLCYPLLPKGEALIRFLLTVHHSKEEIAETCTKLNTILNIPDTFNV